MTSTTIHPVATPTQPAPRPPFATVTDTFVTVYRMGDNWTPVRLDRSPAGRGHDHHQTLAWMGYQRRVGGSISFTSRALNIDVEPIPAEASR